VKHRNPYVGDPRTRQAKSKGFPARSVFKLEEIDERCSLLRASMRVLDLGAVPGSWTLYAANRVGGRGLVVAVDLKPIGLTLPPNAIAFRGDAMSQSEAPWAELAPFDLVMSDMAPNTSGSKIRDQATSFELFNCALASASRLGSRGSHFVAKLFMSNDFQAARSAVAEGYETVRVLRPEGTRQNSSEVYIVGKHRRS
jgi:23S rRNA (uridine2552-2'-O)-methyltransferase